MFTRSLIDGTLCIIVAAIAASFASLAYAEIAKCREHDGSIIYSDMPCANATLVGVIAEHRTRRSAPVVHSTKAMTNVMTDVITNAAHLPDRNRVRESAWTHRDIPTAKKSIDALTIRDARKALDASDRAIASLRQQTLALNR